jgi:Family of unknown function (DUF6298)
MRIFPPSARLFLAIGLLCVAGWSRAQPPAVAPGPAGKLVYAVDAQGNIIPDFSNCGYAGADRDIPNVPAVAPVAPSGADDTLRIQSAIDQVSRMPLGNDGFRGAVDLAPGEFQIAGQLQITTSGVVLRGSGAGQGGTTLLATGPDRRTLIRIFGQADRGFVQKPTIVLDEYLPVGARELRLASTAGYAVGTRVLITRPSTAAWIQSVGADAFGVGWRPGSRDLRWDRVITAIDGDRFTIDAPITTAVEKRFGQATIAPTKWTGRIEHVGIEDLRLVSQPSTDHPRDEDHAWYGITMENLDNAWVRRVEFSHIAGGAVALWETTKWVTVEDCISHAPVSEIGGFRRHAFFTQGQLSLFLRCWSEQGLHDFAVGHCAAGPNAFVNCRTRESLGDSGPLESWASGLLYDNVRIDGNALNLINRWTNPPGAGWSAANCVLWQCRAATIACFRPPTANNWAIGCWAGFSGDGTFESRSDFVRPLSLYQGQLRERIGDEAAMRVDPILGKPVTATNPTLEEAATFVAQSHEPARELVDVIRARIAEHTKASTGDWGLGAGGETIEQPPAPSPQPLTLQNGWLVADGKLVTGRRLDPLWWRGNMRADDVLQFGPNISRFAPGRVGTGFTDDLQQVADMMVNDGFASYDHHYGLWYERRRDDHTMGRQVDGDVAAPFYEQPFARTGDPASGTAWDGLTKYDLTKFNRWYWNRLHDFAQLCDQRGLVLLHENYFQHNILEAGAHWADSPWRPANNVNDTGLPEPPPYIGDKRQFMAPTFYDVTNPKLRALHRGYIRQCLDNFADTSNVIQLTSAEYTGPLEFTQFWLDTIIEWERETGHHVLVALSAPKDVQDAILADPERAAHVDVIDIRYWCYTAEGLYAPDGGQNLAPRQQLRQTRERPGGAAAIVKAVREYRDRYPDKAILYNAEENCPSTNDGWATLVAGGSLADAKLPEELARLIRTMRPNDGIVQDESIWCLADPEEQNILIYSGQADAPLKLNLRERNARYRIRGINPKSGVWDDRGDATADLVTPPGVNPYVLWMSRLP